VLHSLAALGSVPSPVMLSSNQRNLKMSDFLSQSIGVLIDHSRERVFSKGRSQSPHDRGRFSYRCPDGVVASCQHSNSSHVKFLGVSMASVEFQTCWKCYFGHFNVQALDVVGIIAVRFGVFHHCR